MNHSSYSIKEHRLIHLQAGYQDAIRKAQAETGLVDPTYTYTPTKQGTVSATPTSSWTSRGQTVYGYGTALPEKSSPNIVPSGYDINLDPTYAGTMNKELTGWTGGERTGGNVGPTAGFTGTRAEWDAQMAKEADAYANSVVKSVPEGVSRDFNAEAIAREQAKAAFYQQKQLEIEKQRADSERAQRQAGSVGNNLNDAVNNRLKERLTKLEGTRGDFVDAKRAEVDPKTGQRLYSDQQIKKMLQEMPVGTFSNETPITQQPQTPTTITPSQATTQQEKVAVQQSPTPTGAQKIDGKSSQAAVTSPVTIPVAAQSIGEQMYQLAQQNGDPLAGINKALYDDMILKEEQAKRDALLTLGDAMQAAEQENTDTQSYIDKWVNIATKNSDKLSNLLQTQNDETNKVLEKQKENALQKLAFDKQVETQKLERQKAQDVLKSSIAIALRGGAYSGAAQEALADSERQWDIGIQNLAKEFSFKAADVALEFTSQYVAAKQNLALNLYNASEALGTKIEGYSNAGFSSLQAKKSAIASAKSQYKSTIDQIAKDHATELKSMVKTMGETINKSRDDKRAQDKEVKENAYQMFNFAFTNSSDPAIRRSAVEQMRSAGYDLPQNIDYTKLTPDQQIRMLDLVEKQKTSMASLSPMEYNGEAKSIAMMAANVKLNLTDSDKAVFSSTHEPLIKSLLNQGKNEEARRIIYDAAVTNLAQSRKDVADRRAMIGWLDRTIQKLESAESLPGFYTTAFEDSKRFFGVQKDKKYADLMSVVSLASVESLHELYGSALTATEMETARSILPLKGDNMGNALQALRNFRDFQNNKQIEIVNTLSGGGAFGPGSSAPNVSSPTNDDMFNIINGSGGEEIPLESAMVNGRQIAARPSALAALIRANNAMIADGLEGIDIMSAYRSNEQQKVAYDRYKRGEIALAAKPGTSLHEQGIAFDIKNWKKAEKYLKAQGFNPLLDNLRSSDPGHFSFIHVG